MNFPKRVGTLGSIGVELVELDFCSGCKGAWFDSGEVSAYFELTRDFPGEPKAIETAPPPTSVHDAKVR